MPAPDLKSILQDRKAKQAGRLVKHEICLDTDLLERRADLLEEAQNLPDSGDSDGRLAGPSADARRKEIDQELADLETEMVAATVQLVFRTLDYASYERLLDEHRVAEEDEQGNVTKDVNLAQFFPALLRKCFVEFRQHGQKIDSLTAEDWGTLHDTLPYGDADTLYAKVRFAHIGETDLPKSVKRSATTRGSDISSTPPTATASAPAASPDGPRPKSPSTNTTQPGG